VTEDICQLRALYKCAVATQPVKT